MQKVLVLGLGISGQAVASFFLEMGSFVFGVDAKKLELDSLRKKGLQVGSDKEDIDLTSFDLVVKSPGINPNHPLVQRAIKANIEITSEIELAAAHIKQKVLAITGTNGKTTVTLLVEHILNQSGLNAKAVGNVGRPLISQLHLNPDVWVLELSSYQLEDMKTQIVDAGVILNITPDHLDRYESMNSYAAAKLNLSNCIKPNGHLYIQKDCQKMYGGEGVTFGFNSSCDLYFDGTLLIKSKERIEYLLPEEYRTRGGHEVENFMASYALCQECGITDEQITRAVKSFKKPLHRIEFVCKHNGVNYFDDSKGTNVDAVIRAVQSMQGSTVLIAGGVDKGSSYVPWIEGFAGKVKSICAIGQAANKLAAQLGNKIEVQIFDSLEEAVSQASKLVGPGGNVLLSPGCASFDMFRDYEHRGEEFKRIVNIIMES